jgi:menaquinone-dependent protoporphyrinogen oxidase
MTKALIVYGTRYGATASTSAEIANTFWQQGLEVRVVDAKQERISEINEYDLVIVGSGIERDMWTSEPEEFLKTFQEELAKKKVALFVSCGHGSQALNEGKPDVIAKFRGVYLEEKAAKYNLQPLALGLFGGIYDYNKISRFMQMAPPVQATRRKLEAACKETQPGIYDLRDLDAIRIWAKELSQKVLS